MSALPEPLTLRDARHVDLDAVADLERVSFPIPWKREYFEVEVGAPWRFNRVALSDGSLAGYVFCAFAGGEVHVNKIAVAPGFRRQGVASALMDDVFAFAARVNAEEIFLEVRFSNQPARVLRGPPLHGGGPQGALLPRRRGRPRDGPENGRNRAP